MKEKSAKYISSYKEFIDEFRIDEQMGDPMAAMGGPEGGAPPPTPKNIIHSFIFLDHPTKDRIKNYENGGYTARYTSYEIGDFELNKWLNNAFKEKTEENKNCNQEDILNAITGEKFSLTKDEKKFLDKFRLAVVVNHKAEKSIDIDVEFDKNKVPYTDSLQVTFLETIKK